MNEFLNDTLNEISDKHLNEAIRPKKKQRFYWLGAVAAALAIVIFLTSGGIFPMIPKVEAAGLIAAPEYPTMSSYPQDPNMDHETPAYSKWKMGLKRQYDQPVGYADSLDDFFTRSIPLFLAESEENAVCSPLNIYMALAMLAETTGGDSREAVLAALNADSIKDLRTQAGHVWNAHYRADGASDCLLANSLWLNEGYTYNQNTVATLANSYYASVYQGALGSTEMNEALRSWLSQQTRGLLDQYIQGVELSPQDALALASTVYFQARWADQFWEKQNTDGIFHSPGGDVEATFMNQSLTYGPYYYGEDFGAVQLRLDPAGVDGAAAMWLILPDEGYDPQDILASGHAIDMILCQDEENRNSTSIIVHLSLPKFDISAQTDLREPLTALGLGDLFDPQSADFSAILPETEGTHLGQTTHAARVAIDEEGVTAAAYTVLITTGAMVPPEEEMYFTLDRPFLFVVTSVDNLPLFVGVVNEPEHHTKTPPRLNRGGVAIHYNIRSGRSRQYTASAH